MHDLDAHISLIALSPNFEPCCLRSQPGNDDFLPNKSIKKCDKKQPQGRIVDLLKKQAQQLPSDTGLRPTEAPFLSRGTTNHDSHFKRPAPPSSAMVTSAKWSSTGSLEKAAKGTRHQPLNATRDRCLSPAGHVTSVNTANLIAPSDTSTDPKCKSVAQSSATSWSGFVSQPKKARALSTQASQAVSRSLGLPIRAKGSGLSLAVHHGEGVLSQRPVSPASPSTHKKQHHSNSMGRPADLLFTQFSHGIPDQTSMTFTSPLDFAPMHARERPAVEATCTHHIVENPSVSPREIARGEHMYPILFFGVRLIICPQLPYRIQYPQLTQLLPSGLPVLRLTCPLSVNLTNFLNWSPFTRKHVPRISPRPSSSTLPIPHLHVHGNQYMITPLCSPLQMMNGQHFLSASHGLVICQII